MAQEFFNHAIDGSRSTVERFYFLVVHYKQNEFYSIFFGYNLNLFYFIDIYTLKISLVRVRKYMFNQIKESGVFVLLHLFLFIRNFD
jgi:hypothetical protein